MKKIKNRRQTKKQIKSLFLLKQSIEETQNFLQQIYSQIYLERSIIFPI